MGSADRRSERRVSQDLDIATKPSSLARRQNALSRSDAETFILDRGEPRTIEPIFSRDTVQKAIIGQSDVIRTTQ